MSIDPRLERSVLAELALRERRLRSQAASNDRARALAERMHRGRHDLLAHLRRVAHRVPRRFRSVAWLHHAREHFVASSSFTAAGLTQAEIAAIELLAYADPPAPRSAELARVRTIARATGSAGYLARVVAYAALEDRFAGAPPEGDSLAALRLLTGPRDAV